MPSFVARERYLHWLANKCIKASKSNRSKSFGDILIFLVVELIENYNSYFAMCARMRKNIIRWVDDSARCLFHSSLLYKMHIKQTNLCFLMNVWTFSWYNIFRRIHKYYNELRAMSLRRIPFIILVEHYMQTFFFASKNFIINGHRYRNKIITFAILELNELFFGFISVDKLSSTHKLYINWIYFCKFHLKLE